MFIWRFPLTVMKRRSSNHSNSSSRNCFIIDRRVISFEKWRRRFANRTVHTGKIACFYGRPEQTSVVYRVHQVTHGSHAEQVWTTIPIANIITELGLQREIQDTAITEIDWKDKSDGCANETILSWQVLPFFTVDYIQDIIFGILFNTEIILYHWGVLVVGLSCYACLTNYLSRLAYFNSFSLISANNPIAEHFT